MTQYKYVPLVGAKLVGRRHVRDIQLPGLRELKNAFISKSDSSITVRPDFDPISEELAAISDSINFGDSDNEDDFLNAASGMHGTDSLIWLTSRAPIADVDGSYALSVATYADGTVSVTNGSTSVTGTDTAWKTSVWAGCLFEVGGSGTYYIIDSVTGDGDITLTKSYDGSTAGTASYAIHKTHNADYANYKANLQPFTTGMIYSQPSITMPIDENKISGPFYASTSSTSSDTEDGWGQMVDDSALDYSPTAVFDHGRSMVTVGSKIFAAYKLGSTSPNVNMFTSTDPISDWTQITPPPVDRNTWNGWLFSGGDPSDPLGWGGLGIHTCGRDDGEGGGQVFHWIGDGWSGVGNVGRPEFSTVAVSDSGSYVATSKSDPYNVFYGATGAGGTVEIGLDEFGAVIGTNCSVFYSQNTFLLFTQAGMFYAEDDDGSSWTNSNKLSRPNGFIDLAYGNAMWVAVPRSQAALHSFYSLTDGESTQVTSPGSGNPKSVVFRSGKFYVTDSSGKIYSTPNVVDGNWTLEHTEEVGSGRVFDSMVSFPSTGEIVAKISVDNSIMTYPEFAVSNQSTTTTSTTWHSAEFAPLSDIHRALTHSVLDGYVMLLGVRDYDEDAGTWQYYPRRIRWSAPLTHSDFEGTGSGSAEIDGNGALLDSRPVNGRIVTFESSAIGSISPRGFTNDPWEYDVIKSNIKIISNPVVVDDVCFFIDNTGVLMTTNGMTVDEPPFAFDLTEYDDFNSDSPVWLTYAPGLESLVVFNPAASGNDVYLIELTNGSAAKWSVADVANAGGSALSMKSVTCVEHSSDNRMMVSYNPRNDSTDTLLVAESSTGSTVTGIDELTTTATDDTHFVTDIQTPEDWIVQEGTQTGIKHILLRTYCDGTDQATNPMVVVQLKSLEDSDWNDNGDSSGTMTVSTTDCQGTNTASGPNAAWSSLIELAFAGINGSATVFTVPCLAIQARVFLESGGTYTEQTVGTDYTVTDTREITFTTAPANTNNLYVFWENEPGIKAAAGDLVQSTEGWHEINSITNSHYMVLDHYLSTGSDATATHHPAGRMPVGDGEVKIGISKLTEGTRVRIIIMPDSGGDATVAKVTGYSIGHIPAGKKIVEV